MSSISLLELLCPRASLLKHNDKHHHLVFQLTAGWSSRIFKQMHSAPLHWDRNVALAASSAIPWWVRLSIRRWSRVCCTWDRQTDGRTPERCRYDAANVNTIRFAAACNLTIYSCACWLQKGNRRHQTSPRCCPLVCHWAWVLFALLYYACYAMSGIEWRIIETIMEKYYASTKPEMQRRLTRTEPRPLATCVEKCGELWTSSFFRYACGQTDRYTCKLTL